MVMHGMVCFGWLFMFSVCFGELAVSLFMLHGLWVWSF